MKILHCIDDPEVAKPGGLLAQLTAHARPAGLEHAVQLRRPWRTRWPDLLGVGALRAGVERERPDVVQTHGFFSALAASCLVDRPVLHTLHVPLHRLSWLERSGWRWLFGRGAAASAVAISAAVRRSFVFGGGARARAIETVAIGVEPLGDAAMRRERLAQAVNAAPDELLVAAPEPLVARAGHVFLLDAWAALPAELRASARLVLRDAGPLRGALAARAGERVSFAAPALGEHLHAADVVVWASLYGELPAAAAQAMAAARVLIATLPGGIAEQVRDGVEALLVPSQDARALAAALAGALGDPALRSRLGRAAAERFERHLSAARAAAEWAAVYDRVAAGARG